MAEMRAMLGDTELVWTDGVWSSNDDECAALAQAESQSDEPIEIVPLADLPANDDSCEVVSYIMRWVLQEVAGPGVVEYTLSDGMKSRTTGWGYDPNGLVY